jgi:hypothetical protein
MPLVKPLDLNEAIKLTANLRNGNHSSRFKSDRVETGNWQHSLNHSLPNSYRSASILEYRLLPLAARHSFGLQ